MNHSIINIQGCTTEPQYHQSQGPHILVFYSKYMRLHIPESSLQKMVHVCRPTLNKLRVDQKLFMHTVHDRMHDKFPSLTPRRRQKRKFWIGTCDFWAGPPCPPPLTPLLVPQPGQKGYQSALFLNRHPSAYSSRPETGVLQSCGAKTEIRTPMHTLPTRHS